MSLRQETVTVRRLFFVMISAGVSNSLWMLYVITLQDNLNAFSTRNELLDQWTYMEQQQQQYKSSRRPKAKLNLQTNNFSPTFALAGDSDNINMDYYHTDEFAGSAGTADTFSDSTTPLHDLPQELMEFAKAKEMKEDSISGTPSQSGSLWDSMGMQNIGEYLSIPAFLSSDAVSIVSVSNSENQMDKELSNTGGRG